MRVISQEPKGPTKAYSQMKMPKTLFVKDSNQSDSADSEHQDLNELNRQQSYLLGSRQYRTAQNSPRNQQYLNALINGDSSLIASKLNIPNDLAVKVKQMLIDEISKEQTEDNTRSPPKDYRSEEVRVINTESAE